MMKLQPWQWVLLALPPLAVFSFVMVAATAQIHAWGLTWVWALVVVLLVGWRWLLARWLRPIRQPVSEAIKQAQQELEAAVEEATPATPVGHGAEAALEDILTAAQQDPPIWEDWNPFWGRCREVVTAVAQAYHPEVKYPLLSIYVPDAYGLLRGTVDEMDRWMDTLSPVLGQVTVGQAVQGYEVYRKLEPVAGKIWQIWGVAQWILNPAAATARTLSQPTSTLANQQLLGNLNGLLREAALRNLYRQAVGLYGGELPDMPVPTAAAKPLPAVKTQTLQAILDQAEPVDAVATKPLNLLLVGRTGAGKSSLINTLFVADRAEVDVLPSTDRMRSYRWQADNGDSLTLWDSPGYEQAQREDFRDQVIDHAQRADLLLLVTPALDPALQMDADVLADIRQTVSDLPAIAIITQVDRLRPIREWQPPYDWQWGNRPKEVAIREATRYRQEQLGDLCDRVLPLVTFDAASQRSAWNAESLVGSLIDLIPDTQELRLARFLRDRHAKAMAAARLIDRYRLQMSTTQGLASFLKSPVLQFLATLTTGTPTLAYLLADQIPIEQLPVVLGKLQLAYDLHRAVAPPGVALDLLTLWPLLLEHNDQPDRAAWAFGHAMVEYWTQNLTLAQVRSRLNHYLAQFDGQTKTPA